MLIPIRDYNPTRSFPLVTLLLILLNVAVFILHYFGTTDSQAFILTYAMIPQELTAFHPLRLPLSNQFGYTVGYFQRTLSPWMTISTSLFLHGGVMHILGNMLFLWIFGNNVEDRLGKIRFLLFYFFCGWAASLAHTLFHPRSLIPVIGASGAVSGVMGAYLILFPRARIRTLLFLFLFVTFVDVPAAFFLIFWFFYQFLYAGGVSGIAWMAHIGGFLAGIFFLGILRRRRPPKIEFLP